MSGVNRSVPQASPATRSLELTLALSPEGDGSYRVSASSVAGDGTAVIRLPTIELAERSEGIGRAVRSAANAEALPPEIIADVSTIGADLFGAVFVDSVRTAYDHAVRAAEDAAIPLRVVVSLADAPELLRVPWETLYDDPLFLGVQRSSTVVRHVPSRVPLRPVLVQGRVRILGLLASPTDMPLLDVADERQRVERQLEPVTTGGLAELDWLEPATVDGLRIALQQDYHVLHYVGHSALAPSGDGVLVLEKSDGTSQPVSGSLLANMIGRRTQVRFVVLNSCSSAATLDGDPFSGIATKLVALGIPAVTAMQYAIGDAAAVTFGSALYESLISGNRDVEDAVADARLAVLAEGHELDWIAPVLFLQGSDTRLFDLSLIGWYTLDGTRPARSPEWRRPGLLGFRISDSIERALRVFGDDFNVGTLERTTTRQWDFQGESWITFEDMDGSITSLTASVDGDKPGNLRIALPYGLTLGEATLKDTLSAMGVAVSAETGGALASPPKIRRSAAENILNETWTYLCPDSPEGGLAITFSAWTMAGREDPTPEWFSWDMDLSNRRIASCTIRHRRTEDLI